MDGMGRRAGSLLMVDLLNDRFTGQHLHPGAQCARAGSAEAMRSLSRVI